MISVRSKLIVALAYLSFFHFTPTLQQSQSSDLDPFVGSVIESGNASANVLPRSFSFPDLTSRQLQCAIPTDHVCPSGLGCCGATENCLPRGCCEEGNETCDDTGCYEPGATCCQGYACPGTQNCLLGKCCSKTAETCAGTGCWPAGAVCCPNNVEQTCASGQSCCPQGCMPNAQGNTCCGPKYCKDGSFCCKDQEGGCCPDGWSCCGANNCCEPGATCKADGTCAVPVISFSISESTSISTESKSSSTSSKPTSSPTPSKPSISTPKISTSSCVTAVPSPTGAAVNSLPVIEFIYIDTDYEPYGDIVKSMCLGMNARARAAGRSLSNQDILTYSGSKDPCYKTRRRQASCSGCCTGVIKNSGPFQGFSTQCDEYPFASTVEGGSGAHKSCVVGFENSLQGRMLSSYTSKWTYGQQFIVRVVGINCADVQETDLQSCVNSGSKLKRQVNGMQTFANYTDKVRALDNSSTATKGAIMPLIDGSGLYSVNLTLHSGEVDTMAVYSNSGEELDSGDIDLSGISTSGASFAFNLGYDEYGIGVFASTSQNTINMSYSVVVLNSDTSTTTTGTGTAASATSTKKSSAVNLVSSFSLGVFGLAAALLLYL